MKKVLSKDEFCSYLDNVLEREKNAETLSKALQIYANDREFTGFTENTEFDIEFLENLLEDENRWISWWFYEARENPEKYWIECNGTKWVIKSSSDLYDFLFQEESDEINEYYKGGIACLEIINSLIREAEDEEVSAIAKNLIGLEETETIDNAKQHISILKSIKQKIRDRLFMKTGILHLEKEKK